MRRAARPARATGTIRLIVDKFTLINTGFARKSLLNHDLPSIMLINFEREETGNGDL